jgi:hypothetical protein
MSEHLDDLVLHLRGLVLVRELRESRGADEGELEMYGAEIERVREQLVEVVLTRSLGPLRSEAPSPGW